MPYNEKSRANLKTYKPLDELTEEERQRQIELSVKGGQIRGEQIKNAKTWKEVCNDVLKTRVNREKAVKYIGDDVDLLVFDEKGLCSLQEVLTIRSMQIASEGNVKALEFMRDTSGQKPRDEIDVRADIMTDADRSLLDNIKARLERETNG